MLSEAQHRCRFSTNNLRNSLFASIKAMTGFFDNP
jgi:hypothetical protein